MTTLRKPVALRYSLDIPELKKKISYRALTVGEQKNLITALELKDAPAITNCIYDIISGVTFGELDLSKTPMHIVDYVFLKSYIKSSGSKSQVEYTCGGSLLGEDGQEKKCNSTHKLELDLEKAEIKYPENYVASKIIPIDDKMSVKVTVPNFESFRNLDMDKDILSISDQYIFSGIEYIVDGDEIIRPGLDFNLNEMTEWLNSLPANIINELSDFFGNSPDLILNLDVTCPNCGRKDGFELSGLDDFFL